VSSPFLTVDDLHELCWKYVPARSRHPHSLGTGPNSWWLAHELGHYLTVPIECIGRPLFGIGVEEGDDNALRFTEHDRRCFELAAMHVSRCLLEHCDREDLIIEERALTDWETLHWNDDGRVQQILKLRHCVQLPATRARLIDKLEGIRKQVATP
jgi:hypothetical protein